MNDPTQRIREDFDRIALLTAQHDARGAGDIYYEYLTRKLPPRIGDALEIGCGSGAFTRILAARAKNVLALDLSPEMIRLARAHTENFQNIEFRTADVMKTEFPAAKFDCIATIATLHHLPLDKALTKMKNALRAGGTLIIHDLTADDGILDTARSAIAFPISAARRFLKTRRLRTPREIREAWQAHGANEVYLTPREVREMCRRHFPEARVKRHLFWRYTIVWRKHKN